MAKMKLSPEQQTTVVQLYQSGKSMQAIADEFGMTKSGIRIYLKRLCCPTRRIGEVQPSRKMTAETTAIAVELYSAGMSLMDIELSGKVGATAVAIGRALKKAGVQLRHVKEHVLEDTGEDGLLLCRTCGQRKPLAEFAVNRGYKRQREYSCRACSRWRTRLRTYGITREQYQAMHDAQGGRCAICGCVESQAENIEDLVIDHNHTTGAVRGLLCARCNHLIGHARESVDVLQQAITYLQKHSQADIDTAGPAAITAPTKGNAWPPTPSAGLSGPYFAPCFSCVS